MIIKNVVKVMNFHSLLRVDSARKKAEKYFNSEKELTKMIANIIYNRNLILDKKVLIPNKKKPVLDIYIGNDYGFCGNFNSSINDDIKQNPQSYKILIGKKIYNHDDKILLKINKDEFFSNFGQIENIILNSILDLSYSKINIIYNHYYSINSFEFMRKTVFPIEFEEKEADDYIEDFIVETDINSMINNLVSLFICYEKKIAKTKSWAAEKVMRQKKTRESLKKIDEIKIEKLRYIRKTRKYKSFQKIIENYRRGGIAI